jgi:hypothetical protein
VISFGSAVAGFFDNDPLSSTFNVNGLWYSNALFEADWGRHIILGALN